MNAPAALFARAERRQRLGSIVHILMQKPQWVNKKISLSSCRQTKAILRSFNAHSVCEEALCPNITECFKAGVATFLILGNTCTRRCMFCAVSKGIPQKVDHSEVFEIKNAVKKLGLRYVVVTSPTRDDLADGGSKIFCEVVKEIKSHDKAIKVEILIPDFLGSRNSIEKAAHCGADVVSHNIETVPSLYTKVRIGADYRRSLYVLNLVKELDNDIFTKSGLMLGLGEKEEEVIEVFRDLREAQCDFLTLGQYLAPTTGHYPVKEYVSSQKFFHLANQAYGLGFRKVKSSTYTRSSYLAHTFFT
ncbi:MAG: lipoyl synthase [Candidatus Omnitrophota bacterium]|nr:lipoyl synthase [Candidatus Omnitrophota bacterium]